MYAAAIQDVLEENDISPGDRIAVSRDDATYEGRLMPRSRQGDTETLVLKLDNGYNLGIAYTDETDIELLKEGGADEETEDIDVEYDEDLPDVTILHTGGTIASKVSYEAGGVKPAFEPEELFEIYPELFENANIDSAIISQMFSEDMEPAHWQQIAEAVADNRDADGIIIGHGTDTMHYTAAALSFMLENIDIPVVLVGSQRSSDRPSSDAAVNLLSAVEFIKEDVPGVYVCMHGSMSDTGAAIHRGVNVRKMHTSRRDTFKSIDTLPFAAVDAESGTVTFHSDTNETSGEFELRTALGTDVGLLKTRPGIDPELLDRYEDYSGLVVEGTGLGHLPVNVLDDETEHHEDILEKVQNICEDTVVAMSSQCINGRVNMNVYDSGVKLQQAGVVSAENMMPEVAYVKLMWALGQTDTLDEAKELFTTNVAGELIDAEDYNAFN